MTTGMTIAEKRDLLRRLQQQKQQAVSYPLSYNQRRFWLLEELQPGAYNMPNAVVLNGHWNSDTLQRCLNQVAQRHSVLRSHYTQDNGEFSQTVSIDANIKLRCVDVSASQCVEERDQQVKQLLHDDAWAGFDLRRGPVARALLVRFSDELHWLQITLHHICCDGWSLNILTNELSALYHHFRYGTPLQLPELPIQYTDYAVWQRGQTRQHLIERDLTFWQEKMATPTVLELPVDLSRPKVLDSQGERCSFEFSGELSRAIDHCVKRDNVSLYMLLLSSFMLLLARITQQTDIIVATPQAGRDKEELQHLIGCFINTMLIRATVPGTISFQQLLAQVRQTVLQAMEHNQAPFEDIVDAVIEQRDSSRPALAQVAFALQNQPQTNIHSGLQQTDLSLSPLEVEGMTVRFELECHLWQYNDAGDLSNEKHAEQKIAGFIAYNTQLFKVETIERLISQWRSVLEQLVKDSSLTVDSYSLLSENQHKALLSLSTGVANRGLVGRSLNHVLAESVSQHADSIALRELSGDADSEQKPISYKELSARVDQRARQLLHSGVKQGDWVAFRLARDSELIITMLAITRVGASYVPLDLAYPLERVQVMLQDSGASLLVTTSHLQEELQSNSNDDNNSAPMTLLLDQLDPDQDVSQTPLPELDALAAVPAYMMYSSGSTGRPKGIVVEQSGIMRLVCGSDYIQIKPGSRIAQAANTSFDAATFEIWGALLNGATVVMLPRELTLEPELFAEALLEQQIDTLFLTTALFNQVVAARRDAFKGLTTLLMGGEAVDVTRVRSVLAEGEAGAPERMLHVYGPTENTTFSSWQWVKQVADDAETVPIGRAIAGSSCYVLDQAMNLVAPGLAGELYVGGLGVAQGYWSQAALTAKQFVPDPYSPQAGARLYATGDRVCWNDQGELEFLGRIDDQIKLRGLRIEPGAIAAALCSHGDVEQAHVVFSAQEQQLTGYWCGVAGSDVSPAQLQQHLSERVAAYEIPAALVKLEQLPLTANGKVDVRSLPLAQEGDYLYQLEREGSDHGLSDGINQAQVATQSSNPLYEVVSQLWCKLLKLSSVEPEDDFFVLGGHSLLATQMVTRLQKQLGVQLPVRSVFEASDLQGFVAQLDDAVRQERGSVLPAITPAGKDQAGQAGVSAELSFAQQRLWFMEQVNPLSPAYYINMALRLQGALDREALQQALNTVLQRHSVLRTVYRKDERKEVVQHVLPVDEVPLDVLDLSNEVWVRQMASFEQTEELQELLQSFAERDFDLQHDLMLRTKLIVLSELDSILAITVHHIAGDGWSLGVLAGELSAAYTSLVSQTTRQLPDLPIQYHDFSRWQRQSLKGVLHKQLNYWREQLNELPAVNLPLDRPRPAQQTFAGAVVKIEIDADTAHGLQALCQQHDATLYMALLGAYQSLLSRLSGQTDIAVGSPVANRNHPGLENLIGFFVNMLVMRMDVSDDPNYLQVLSRIRDTALHAYANQDLPFEKIVEALAPERDGSRQPLFQIHFALQNAPTGALALPDLNISPLSSEINWVRFDLECHLWHESDGVIRGYWVYNTDLLDEQTVQSFSSMFLQLLRSWLQEPNKRLSAVPLMEAEQLSLPEVDYLPDEQKNYAKINGLGGLFTQTATQFSESIAVTTLDAEHLEHRPLSQQHSYQTLEQRANYLAHQLLAKGVGPEVRVGLMAERGIDLLTGLLGILKAGGVYVPLDPAYPSSRLQGLIDDAKPLLTLCDQASESKLADGQIINEGSDKTLLITDLLQGVDSVDSVDASEIVPPTVTIDPDSAAYIIYTSGSTGKPKGVVVSHRQVLRLLDSCDQQFDFDHNDVWTLFHSYAFDFSVWEIWGAWHKGGRLLVVPHALSRNPDAFLPVLQEQKVTVLNQTPSAFYSLIAADQSVAVATEAALSLRWVIFGGEALEFSRLQPWVERYGCGEQNGLNGAKLVNMYGITETTVHVTWLELDSTMIEGLQTSDLGDALSDLQLYVLDAAMQLVPAGVVGELYVGGAGVSRGYLNQPGLTASRFVPDPFLAGGTRLYRTGDLARRSAQGALQYLGRSDQQVQLRGFRIELEEIEACLVQDPKVKSAAVTVYEAKQDDQRLAAYIVPNETEGQQQVDVALQSWKDLYDRTYSQSTVVDEAFDITGWNSSYSREAIPAQQMREWLDGTLERLLSFKPQRVLELGCGSGMILHGLAEQVQHYHGLDLSQTTIDNLQRQVDQRGWSQVSLQAGSADDLMHIGDQAFDMVVINSVAQYFPNQDYLCQVIRQALTVLSPGGVVFVGDVRSLPRLSSFHASVARYQAQQKGQVLADQALLQAVQGALSVEEELVVDPALFAHLCDSDEAIEDYALDYKRGHGANEMLHYRYDACLFKAEAAGSAQQAEVLTQDIEQMSAEQFRLWLESAEELTKESTEDSRQDQGSLVYVPMIPDRRVLADITALSQAQLSEFLNEVDAHHPEALALQVQKLGYGVRLMPCPDQPGAFSALLFKADKFEGSYLRSTAPIHSRQRWLCEQDSFTNIPKVHAVEQGLIAQLKERVKQQLPQHMWPSTYTSLTTLPMTINGKLDRKALPAPAYKKQHADNGLGLAGADEVLSIRPRTGLEMQLLSVWADITGVESCGITDDFFDLGGHSMTVMKLVDSIQKKLQKTVPMAIVFQCPTVEKMADWLVNEGQSQDTILLPFSPVLSKHEQNRPIFAYPPLTGMPLCYYELSVALNTIGNTVGQRQPFYGLQAPGINDNAQPLNSIKLMAQRYLQELTRVSPQGPYRLMGWSLGGMVAFETARMLVDAGYEVEQLVLVDAAPFSAFEQDVSHLLADPIGFTADTLALELPEHLSDQQKMPFMLKQAVALKVLPSWFDLEALQRLSAVIIASMTAYIDYEPGLYTGQMTLVKASASPEWDDVCPQKVWSTYCQQVNLVDVPQGTHDNLLQAPQLDYVVRSIND